jgi:hypothetical protein
MRDWVDETKPAAAKHLKLMHKVRKRLAQGSDEQLEQEQVAEEANDTEDGNDNDVDKEEKQVPVDVEANDTEANDTEDGNEDEDSKGAIQTSTADSENNNEEESGTALGRPMTKIVALENGNEIADNNVAENIIQAQKHRKKAQGG